MTLLQTFFPEFYNITSTNLDYNLVRKTECEFLLELNVAGIANSDINVEVSENRLSVSANIKDSREYLHKGISTKSFKYHFNLRDDIVVKEASIKNGILTVALELQISEEKKPRKIPIMH